MEIGDCFTIEPALVQGRNSRGMMWDDGWTMSTEVSVVDYLVPFVADHSLERGVLNSSIKYSSLKTAWRS